MAVPDALRITFPRHYRTASVITSPAIEGELFAAIKHFHNLLESRFITVSTDNQLFFYAAQPSLDKASPRQLNYILHH